jgi:hypothetical protein
VTHQNVAEQELSDFLTNSMRREGVLNQIIMTDRLDIFFEWLRDPKLLKRYTIDDPNIFWVLLNNRQFAVEDEYIEIYHSQLIEALLCIVDQFQVKSLKSKQGIDFLLDELVFLNSCRMNAAKICTLNYLHWQLEDKSFRYYQQVRQNETKIVAGLKKHLDDARLWDHSFQHRRFVESRGIGCFSRIASEIYLEKLDKILQNPSECTHRLTLVLEVMCMRSYKGSYAKWQERRGEWSGINPVMKPFLLPNAEYEKQFLAALEKLDKSLLTENERTLLSNFTSYN